MSQNQFINNLLNQYGSQFTLSEREWIMDCDDWPTLEAISDFVKNFGVVTWNRLKDIYRALTGKAFNDDERQILEGIDGPNYARIQFIIYASNAYKAMKATGANFKEGMVNGQNAESCGECIGNAFKHAFFICLNAASFGRNIANQLGLAHEGTVVSLSATMDRHNNAEGLLVYNSVNDGSCQGCVYTNHRIPLWIAGINEKIEQGSLRYVPKNPMFPEYETKDECVPTTMPGTSRQ